MQTKSKNQNTLTLSYKFFFWNILCDEYSFDWKTAPNIELKYKVWDYRQKLFKKIFSDKKTISDIYCFIEVDKQYDIFYMINSNYDKQLYECVFYPRPNTPLGIMLCYNRFKFKLLSTDKYLLGLKETQNFALCAIFQEVLCPYSNICVLVTHLTAWDKNEHIRIKQIHKLFDNMKSDKALSQYKIEKFVLCGDFNTGPSSECIQILNKNGFESVFDINEKNDNYTIVIDTFDEGLKKLKFDYIFTTKNVRCLNKSMASEFLDFERGIPNENFPSDHIYLQAELAFE